MKFVDEASLKVQAGNGGRGMVSFRREKFVPFGGPEAVMAATAAASTSRARGLNTLADFRISAYKAGNGDAGSSRDCTGRGGETDITIPVRSALVQDVETQEVIGDLTQRRAGGPRCQGGPRGLGNKRFKSSTNRSPRQRLGDSR